MPPKKSDEPTEEELAAAAAAEALRLAEEEEAKNPFSKYDKIWELESLEDQRKFVAEIFSLDDGPSHSRQAIILDNLFHHLVFCKSVGMIREQAEEFYNIYQNLENSAIKGSGDVEVCLKKFRSDILNNSTLKPVPKAPAKVVVEEIPSEEDLKSTKNKSTSKSKKGKSLKEPLDIPPPQPVVPEKDPSLKLFTPEQMKEIITYSTEGLFGHFHLYRCMFNREVFKQKTFTDTIDVRVNTVIGDGLALADAVEQSVLQERRDQEAEKVRLAKIAEEERLAELRKPEIAKMVEKQLAIARHEMMKMLDEQNTQFETELEEIIASLQG